MKKSFYLLSSVICALLSITSLSAQDFTGKWIGTLILDDEPVIKIGLHITQTETGTYSTNMTSPDQGVMQIPTQSTLIKGDSIEVKSPIIMAEFSGKWIEDKIEGVFKQMGVAYALTLVRDSSKLVRPQMPKTPFPYDVEEVRIFNKKDSIHLAGTLTLPKDKKATHTVILVTGSGAQNRDEELLGHKPFWVIADFLTRKGIAVLRCDDRGTAMSEGNFATATNADFATDVMACVDYLKAHPRISPRGIGIAGHSAGGSIAFRVAAQRKDIAFIISLAGATASMSEALLFQTIRTLDLQGVTGKAKQQYIDWVKNMHMVCEDTSKSPEEVTKAIDEIVETNPVYKVLRNPVRENVKKQFLQLSTPWFLDSFRHKVSQDIAQTRCPVWAVNGERDKQVEAKTHLDVIKKTLPARILKRSVIKEYPGLNHLFQTCTTGDLSEYGKIEETIAPQVLEDMVAWILQLK